MHGELRLLQRAGLWPTPSPRLMLGGVVAIRGVAYYLATTLPIVVLGGPGLWALGRGYYDRPVRLSLMCR